MSQGYDLSKRTLFVFRSWHIGTLGTRDFSFAVSGVGQVFIVTRRTQELKNLSYPE